MKAAVGPARFAPQAAGFISAPGSATQPFQLRGDPALLEVPRLGLFTSRQVPADLVFPSLALVRELGEADTPIVGGFHSRLEREYLELLLRYRSSVVVCPARAIGSMRLPGSWRRAMDAGHLALASATDPRNRRVTAATAAERNRLVLRLAHALLVVHAPISSRTFAHAAMAIDAGLEVFTFDHPRNADLRLLGARVGGESSLTKQIRGWRETVSRRAGAGIDGGRGAGVL